MSERPEIPAILTHREYFESLFMDRVNKSPLPKIDTLNAIIQFQITDDSEGVWNVVIEKGLVRSFYNINEREINVWFGFESGILGSVMPLFFSQPSIENIQFLEDTTLYYISSNDLESFYKSSQEMNTIGRKMAEEYCKILEERSFLLQTHTAEQRYHWLLKNQPEALQRISLGHIASYLGISQETLSRIRKK